MQRSVIVVAGLALAGLVFVGGMGLGERRALRAVASREPAPTHPANTVFAARESDAHAAVTPAAASATWPPLPDPDVKVADVFDQLAARAARGDAGAACRLAADLQRCAQALGQRALADDLQDQAARRAQTPPGLVDTLARLETRNEGLGTRCDGLAPAQLSRAYDFQRQAAMARPALRVWFALSPALERRDFVAELERWADYRALAMPWLEAAARRGDLQAMIALARVHGDLRRNSPPLPPFRLDDPVRSLAWNDALLRLGFEFRGLRIGAAQARARLDADGLAQAAALTDGLPLADLVPPDRATMQSAMDATFETTLAATACEAAP